MVVSEKHVAVIDPHRKSVKVSETSPAGTRKRLSEFFKYSSHVSTFESIFGLCAQAESYKGTIFRFPLRQNGSNSEISSNVYTPKMIEESHLRKKLLTYCCFSSMWRVCHYWNGKKAYLHLPQH